MINEFIDFCSDLFPSIAPYKINNLKKAIEQFRFTGKTFDVCRSTPLEDLSQGDVFEEIPFRYINDEGKEITLKRKAMLLSNTCDASRNSTLIFAALIPLDEFQKEYSSMSDIKNNIITQLMYIPCNYTQNEAVDFGLINSYSRIAFNQMLNLGKTNKIYSLNDYGFYMLLSKITMFFCRRQDVETEAERQKNIT